MKLYALLFFQSLLAQPMVIAYYPQEECEVVAAKLRQVMIFTQSVYCVPAERGGP